MTFNQKKEFLRVWKLVESYFLLTECKRIDYFSKFLNYLNVLENSGYNYNFLINLVTNKKVQDWYIERAYELDL